MQTAKALLRLHILSPVIVTLKLLSNFHHEENGAYLRIYKHYVSGCWEFVFLDMGDSFRIIPEVMILRPFHRKLASNIII